MRYNTKEKSLIILRENGIIFKIKNFFNILLKKDNLLEVSGESISTHNEKSIEQINDDSNKKIDVLELQKEYRSGKINAEDLTQEQIELLNDLYDKQIEEVRRSNEFRKKKIITYKTKLGLN